MAYSDTQSKHDPELIPIRDDEHLPVAKLADYLCRELGNVNGPMEVEQFGGGKANLTYLVRFDTKEFVLRRPPLGPIAPGAHDMGREHRVLSQLYQHLPLAPRSYLHCQDNTIIGAEFQLMERRHGQVIRETLPAAYRGDPGIARRVGIMVVDALAELHNIDRVAAGLGDLGRPDGFAERQLKGWKTRWDAAAHEANANMDRLFEWLSGKIPRGAAPTIIHNDYKLDNLLVGLQDPAEAVAILDWDMCTSGDPLLDLGYLLNQWPEPGDAPHWSESASMPGTEPGFPSRADAIARYAERTGFDVTDIHWYFAFAALKFAVIIQQIFIRFHRGQTQDRRFANYDDLVRSSAHKGCDIAGIGPSPS